MDDETKDIKQAQEEAASAARSGNPLALVEALSQEFVLDGLTRRLQAKWPKIPEEDVDGIIAESVEQSFFYVQGGKQLGNLWGYLWKTGDYKAHQYHRNRSREMAVPLESLELVPSSVNDPNKWGDDSSSTHDELRKQAISVAKGLLPRLGQENVQAVMRFIIDAVDLGYEDITNQEIADALGLSTDTVKVSKSRGFMRLSRLAHQENLIERDFEFILIPQDGNEEDQRED